MGSQTAHSFPELSPTPYPGNPPPPERRPRHEAGHARPDADTELIQALQDPACYGHPCGDVEVLETHLSWVLLTGAFAYKIKKPVNLGFVDFTTLDRRRHFCEEELRLNRRLAPQIYLDVVAITGHPDAPRVGGAGPAIEYAVRMVQFPQEQLAARQLAEGRLEDRHLDTLAHNIAAFHDHIPWAGAAMGHGDPERVHTPVRQNFAQLLDLLGTGSDRRRVEALARWSETRFAAARDLLQRRQETGHVRECHGDLHLGNMALLDGRLVMFDCIEFNPALRWMDTASEVAFVVMDLLYRGSAHFAHRFLNAYLEIKGDYESLQILDYYLVYRAVVRAKVAAIRARQSAHDAAASAAALDEARAYLKLAASLTRPRHPALLITHGLSGSGKTMHSQALVEGLGMIRLRSDVERKRLFGLAPSARTAAGQGIYSPEATARTYEVLEERAAAIVQAGYGAMVDATFLRQSQRARFADLACRLGCPFVIMAFEARLETLRRRVASRAESNADVSEATLDVLEAQLQERQDLSAGERAVAVVLDTERPDAAEYLTRAVSARLNTGLH